MGLGVLLLIDNLLKYSIILTKILHNVHQYSGKNYRDLLITMLPINLKITILSKVITALFGICSAILTKQALLKRHRHRLKQLINHK